MALPICLVSCHDAGRETAMTLSSRAALLITVGAVVSLCVNLFLIGLLVGSHWHEGGPRHLRGPGPMAFENGMQGGERPGERPEDAGRGSGLMVPVPPEIRQQLKAILAPHEAEIEQSRKAMRAARSEVAKQLATEPLDLDGLKQALNGLQQQSVAMQQMMHDMLLEAAPKLSPEMRQRWAERWTGRQPQRPEQQGSGASPPPPPPGEN